MSAAGQQLTPDILGTILFRKFGIPEESRLIVAYSGGRDSQVLLHCLSRLSGNRPGMKVIAAHYDHGIHPDSAIWTERCREWARMLGAGFMTDCAGTVLRDSGNQEARARRMRYGWLDRISRESDMVLTAHHANDQAETFLMNLVKGKGMEQLSGMEAVRPLIRGSSTLLVRPLLDLMQASLEEYASRHRLEWIEDPSNRDQQIFRNFFRHGLLPILYQRGIITPETLNRGSLACRAIMGMQQREGTELLLRCSSPSNRGVFCLTDPVRITAEMLSDNYVFGTVLRLWVHAAGKPSPSEKQIRVLMEQVIHGKTGHAGLDLDGDCIRYYSRHVFLTTRTRAPCPLQQDLQSGIDTLHGLGLGMEFDRTCTGLSPEVFERRSEWNLVWRHGNMKMRLPGRQARSPVRRLQQQRRVPPWERHAVPNIMLDGEVIWSHGVGAADGFRTGPDETGFQPRFSRSDPSDRMHASCPAHPCTASTAP